MFVVGQLNIDQNFSSEKYDILKQLFTDRKDSDTILFLSVFKNSRIEPFLLKEFKDFLKSLDHRVLIIPGDSDFDRKRETFLSFLSDRDIEVIETAREIDDQLFIPSYEINSINLDILYRYSSIYTTDLKIRPFFKDGRWDISDLKKLRIISSGFDNRESIYIGSPFQTDFGMNRRRVVLQVENKQIKEIEVPQVVEYITIKRVTDSRYQIEDNIFNHNQLLEYLNDIKDKGRRFKGKLLTYVFDKEIKNIKNTFKSEVTVYLYNKLDYKKLEENSIQDSNNLVRRILNCLSEEERSYLDKLQII